MKILFLSLLVAGFFGYQGIHFYEYHDACLRTQLENEYLLKNPLCSDPWQRRLHGPKQEQVCQHAATENRVHPLACAWKRSWDRMGIIQLWTTVTESYWLLFGIITPTCCMMVIMMFWTWNQSSARKATMTMQREVLGAIKELQYQPPPLREKKEKRPKVFQLVAEPSYVYREREGNSRLELLNI